MTDKKLKGILKKVAEDVEAGRSVALSFQERGASCFRLFSLKPSVQVRNPVICARAFETMYQHYDKQVKMRAKVRNALIYPVFRPCTFC